MPTRSASATTSRRNATEAQSSTEAGPSRLPALTERRLVNHLNKFREVATFTEFDPFVESVAGEWMDAMLQQAHGVRQNWETEYEANQTGAYAAMAGEMLKTPSRKKATARKDVTRTTSKTHTKGKSTTQNEDNPFDEPHDKENTPVPIVETKTARNRTAPSATAAPLSNTQTKNTRSTRSKADKEPAKLPNPFQTKLLQAKSRAASQVGPTAPSESAQHGKGSQDRPSTKSDPRSTSPAEVNPIQHSEPLETDTSVNQTPATEPSATPRRSPLPASKSQPQAGEDSMEVECTLTETSTFDSIPKESTPTGQRSHSNTFNRWDQLAEIGDAQPSSSEAEDGFSDAGAIEEDVGDRGHITDVKEQPDEEMTQREPREASVERETGDKQVGHGAVTAALNKEEAEEKVEHKETESLQQDAPIPSSSRDVSEAPAEATTNMNKAQGDVNAPSSPVVAPRTKRTLASFGGTKKSLGHTLQAHAASTPAPANTAFKSSFLNKSLRKASSFADEDKGNEEDSFDLSLPTKANTEANAAAVLNAKPAASTSESQQKQSAGVKRKSDAEAEVQAGEAPQRKKASKSGEPAHTQLAGDRPPLSRGSSQVSETESQPRSQNGHISRAQSTNLLRSKLESARLQRSANVGSMNVGLGNKVLTSPLLNRGQFSPPAPSTPELDNRAGVLSPPRNKGGNVSELLDRWEAKSTNNSARSSPRKSLVKKTSPSKLPIPKSSTPNGSPGPKALRRFEPLATQDVMATEDASDAGANSPDDRDDAAASESAVTAKEDIQEENDMSGQRERESEPHQPNGKRHSLDEIDESDLSSQKEEDDADDEDVEGEEDDEDEDEDEGATKMARPLSQYRGAEQASGAFQQNGERSSGTVSRESHDKQTQDAKDDAKAPIRVTDRSSSEEMPRAAAALKEATIAPQSNANAPWSSRLKSVFMTGGLGMGMAPGTGFQPNKNRSATNSSTASTASTAASVSSSMSRAPSAASTRTSHLSATSAPPQQSDQTKTVDAWDEVRPNANQGPTSVQKTGKLASMASQKAKAGEDKETERKRRSREEEDKTGPLPQQDRSAIQRPGNGQQVTGNSTSASSAASRARVVSQFGQAPATGSNAKLKASVSSKATPVGGQMVVTANGKKRRLTHENETQTVAGSKTAVSTANTAKATGGAAISVNANKAAQSKIAGPARPGQQIASGAPKSMLPATTSSSTSKAAGKAVPGSARQPNGGFAMPQRPGLASQNSHNASNFTQANPFQQARVPGTPAANATAMSSSKTPRPMQHPRVASFASPNVDDDNMSLPSIASEYSDSEDEATQARRARAAPWTKGQALATALRNQATMDTDEIFGVPRGTVDLNVLMPPRDAEAHKRVFRPRSSSANWSGPDGLAQWEIQRYNERMNIQSQQQQQQQQRASGGGTSRQA
ncbi:unnamed protein product [Sympodiomycopsis kandeliae]